ncbi:hypothetical protein D5S18_23340 [Nocardia panacis]|uniref:Uncharacterized protein n=1 Tax=Nocardia panacis TaxID=2340916 RepID=A0A3A4K2J4_9NOCA|nr:hypothetical protein D5S18_23340 [Nocardia panacis]
MLPGLRPDLESARRRPQPLNPLLVRHLRPWAVTGCGRTLLATLHVTVLLRKTTRCTGLLLRETGIGLPDRGRRLSDRARGLPATGIRRGLCRRSVPALGLRPHPHRRPARICLRSARRIVPAVRSELLRRARRSLGLSLRCPGRWPITDCG